jgi:hypothetical protein
MIRIENPTTLEILRLILGTTVAYGILGKRATLKDNCRNNVKWILSNFLVVGWMKYQSYFL